MNVKRINCLNRLSWILVIFAVFAFMHTTLGLDIRWVLVISFAFWLIAVLIVNQVKNPKAERKDFVKFFVGMVLIFSGSVLGLYVGAYLCLYGGIVQIIHGIKANFEWSTIAFGILRVVGTGPEAVIATALVSNIGAKLASVNEVHQRGK